MPLSDTARSILTEASQHSLGLATPPAALPAAARHAVLRSMVRQGLVAEYSAPVGHHGLGWRQADGTTTAVQITEAGRQAIGYDEPENAFDDAELGDPTRARLEDDHDPIAAASTVPANGPTELYSESLGPPTANPVWSLRRWR